MKTEPPPKVCVVVLNWNGCQDTVECVRSLQKLHYRNADIIVVDNGSEDTSVITIRRAFPQVNVIEAGSNLGFAEGNNVGIRYALQEGADYVFILNNDTVVDPNIVDELVSVAESRLDGGVFGAKIFFYAYPNRIWYAGGKWSQEEMCFAQVGDGQEDRGQFDRISTTEFVVGCAMFIPSKVFSKIGLLEPRYFLNYEEIDFCFRASSAGYQNIFVPKAKLWHKISASFGGENSPLNTYFTFRNRLLWARRNLGLDARIAIHLSVYRGFGARFVRPLLQGRSAESRGLKRLLWSLSSAIGNPNNRAWLMGIRDYWLGRFGQCPPQVWALQQDWKSKRS